MRTVGPAQLVVPVAKETGQEYEIMIKQSNKV